MNTVTSVYIIYITVNKEWAILMWECKIRSVRTQSNWVVRCSFTGLRSLTLFFFALRCCYRIFVLNLTYWFLCQFGFLQLVVFECSAVNSKNTLFFSKINFVSIFNFFVCFNMQSKLHLCNVIRTHSPCLAFNVLYFKPNVTLIDRTRKINFRNLSRLLNVRE